MIASPTDLKYFIEISKTLNISRAAERIGITQPTLTQSLKKLEFHFGTELFLRSKSGMKLTRAGEKLLPNVEKLLLQWDELKSEVLSEEMELRGSFKFGCHPVVAKYTLPRFFNEIHKEAPLIDFNMTFDLSRRITEKVVSHQLDFAFVINPYPHPDLVIKKIFQDTVYLWEAKNRKTKILYADLELHQTQTILKKMKAQKIEISKIVPVSDLFVIQALLAEGCGYAILPSQTIDTSILKNIKTVSSSHCFFHDELAIVYRREMMQTKTAKFILEVARKIFTGV